MNHVHQKEILTSTHQTALQVLRQELTKKKVALKRLSDKFSFMKKMPYGYRTQIRQWKDLSSLSQTGGHAKVQRKIIRELLVAQTTATVQERNATEG
jgi:hypothetical protein